MQADPEAGPRKRTNGVKQEVYHRLSSGTPIMPDDLAAELGCSATAVAFNIRAWEKEGNPIRRERDTKGFLVYVPGSSGSPTGSDRLPVRSEGFLVIPQMRMPRFGQLLQVTGIGAFDNSRVSVILRDEEGQSWAADLTAKKED